MLSADIKSEVSTLSTTPGDSCSLETELRHLPAWVRSRLGQLVEDRSGQWQGVMAAIPQSPPWYPGMPLPPSNTQYSRKYSAQDCRLYMIASKLIFKIFLPYWYNLLRC